MSKKTVLVVDDEANIRLLVHRALDKTYMVIEAGDGEEAIKIARGKKPDIILMDIMMPRMDGYTACSTIKSDPSLRTIPVIMLTGLGYPLNKELAKKLEADGYMTKPFTSESLRNTIEQYLGKD